MLPLPLPPPHHPHGRENPRRHYPPHLGGHFSYCVVCFRSWRRHWQRAVLFFPRLAPSLVRSPKTIVYSVTSHARFAATPAYSAIVPPRSAATPRTGRGLGARKNHNPGIQTLIRCRLTEAA